MKSGLMQDASQIDEALSVQLEFLNGGASGLRQTQQDGKIVVPNKVIAPNISARMEDKNYLSRERVAS